MLIRATTRRWAAATLFLLALGACDRVAADPDPAEALVPSLPEVAPGVLEALPEGITVEMLEEGRRHYVVCSVCHGLEGEGTQLGPPLRDGSWLHIDGGLDAIAEIVRSGVESPAEYPVPMPIMGGGAFTPDELHALSAYVYALGRGAP